MSLDALVPILVALVMAVPGILAWRSQSAKDFGEVAERYRNLALSESERCEELEKEADRLEDENRALLRYVRKLKAQLVMANMEPVTMEEGS
jgi:hypothetical protein